MSAVFPVDDPSVPVQIGRLIQLVPEGTVVFAGGPAVEPWRDQLVGEGAIVLSRLGDLRRRLEEDAANAGPTGEGA